MARISFTHFDKLTMHTKADNDRSALKIIMLLSMCALVPRAYISCDSEGCDEGLIGCCLAAPSFLDDDKLLTCKVHTTGH